MPELPETETIARDLNGVLAGRTIASVTVLRRDVLRPAGTNAIEAAVPGAQIRTVWRRAKSVVVDLSTGDRIVVTPRFTGGLRYELAAGGMEDPFVALRFGLRGGGELAYRDIRRLGTVALLTPSAFATLDARLGVEPLDSAFTASRLSGFLRESRQAVKKILMDQRRLAGVGNIYANEALWLAAIDPSRPGRTITGAEALRLHAAVVGVLSDAIAARGTTFRDFRDARGAPGGYAAKLAAYGRGGLPCRRCGTRLALTHAVDGRATVFCHSCQR